jgi:hypothetical protein
LPPDAGSKFAESHRERFLTSEELGRLGSTIREAETIGISWTIDPSKATARHLPKAANRFTKIDPLAAAALRGLSQTGHNVLALSNPR